jgi:hypothetical protein
MLQHLVFELGVSAAAFSGKTCRLHSETQRQYASKGAAGAARVLLQARAVTVTVHIYIYSNNLQLPLLKYGSHQRFDSRAVRKA